MLLIIAACEKFKYNSKAGFNSNQVINSNLNNLFFFQIINVNGHYLLFEQKSDWVYC